MLLFISEIYEFFDEIPSTCYYVAGGVLLVVWVAYGFVEGNRQMKREAEQKAKEQAEREAAELAEKERIEKMPLIEEKDGKTILNTMKLPDGKTTLSGTYWFHDGKRFRFFVESENITIISLNGCYTVKTDGGILEDLSFAYDDNDQNDSYYDDGSSSFSSSNYATLSDDILGTSSSSAIPNSKNEGWYGNTDYEDPADMYDDDEKY